MAWANCFALISFSGTITLQATVPRHGFARCDGHHKIIDSRELAEFISRPLQDDHAPLSALTSIGLPVAT
jgi:hypothetical protein